MDDLLPRLQQLKAFFATGATKGFAFRKKALQSLQQTLLQHEAALLQALYEDLKKNKEESWVTEIGFLHAEIRHTLRHLRRWMKPEKVPTNLLNFPSKSFIYKEPLGVVLIIGPWNYPLQLLLAPLVGALAAGNCVVLKPSEQAPATAAVIKQLVEQTFAPDFVCLIEGEGATLVPHLMKSFRFDHVFFTGSTAVGKQIYEMAAQQLVPVTLELGGKSPCVIESDADITVAARRIAVTRFSNAGQMCVAPDYLLVHHSVKSKLVSALIRCIREFYSDDPASNYNYGKIIHEKAFLRLLGYLQDGKILYGGEYSSAAQSIAPTLLDEVDPGAAVMSEEIFGPVLPIFSFETFEEARTLMERHPNPLAFYVFTGSRQKAEKWLHAVSFGGGCVNNASWHLTNFYLPFGGRGNSGTGAYHGKYSFAVFSHQKAVMKTPVWFDPKIKYPPFAGKLKWFKRIIR